MSLILEALRKSEAERRRGVAPDVAMELPPAPAARARAVRPWVWPVLAFAAIAILALAWWPRRETAAPPEPVAAPAASAAPPVATVPVIVARPAARSVAPPVEPVAVAAPAAAPVATAPASLPAQPSIAPASPPPGPPDDVPDIDASSMPQVRLSMHMWNETPSQRFVILNGQRMAEGDRNGDLAVVAIERDGVVVERDGQRARVPLP